MKTKKILAIFGIIIFLCSFFIWPINQAWATAVGPNSPGTNANDSSVGTITWTNLDNDKTSNNQYATTGNMDSGNTTVYLKATNFGFAIPAGVVIDGISVSVERKASDANFYDNAIRIVKGGTIGTTDKSSGSAWPTNDGTVTYGGAADLWGQTWTYTDINSANFGFAISAKKVGGNNNKKPSIDWINITITYHTPPTPTNTPTPTPTPVPCKVTTSPSVHNMVVGEEAIVTASVTSGQESATIDQMRFGSYNTGISTVNPTSDSTLPYLTTVTAVAAGTTAVWGTADLSDGRTCEAAWNEDTDINVVAPTPTPTNTPTPIPPTSTPIPPTNTPTPIDTPTLTPTSAPSPAATSTPAPTATPTPVSACGNGICEASIGESCSVCAADCGVCPTATPTPTPTPAPAATDTPTPELGATETPTPASSETSTPTPETTSTTSTTTTSTSTTTTTATPTPTPFIAPTVAINPINPAPQTGARVTVTGSYSSGTLPVSRVEVSLDNGLTWFLPQTSDNGFTVTLENLDDGNYPVLARAIDTSDKIGQSNTQTLLIDNLPPIVGGSVFALGPQILLPNSKGFVNISTNTPIKTAISTRGGVIKAEVKSDGQTFLLSTVPGTNIWTGELAFAKAGVKNLVVSAVDGVGKTTERPIGSLLVEPSGNVINKDQKQAVKDASVSVFFFDQNSQSWTLWDGLSYGQTNPKKVDANGNYSFMVPAGRYFVQTDAPGYKQAQSSIFDFTNTSVLY